MIPDDRIWHFVQARTASRRLPGKVLKELSPGRNALSLLEESLRHCRGRTVFLVPAADKELVEWLRDLGAEVWRAEGPEDDVFGRFQRGLVDRSCDLMVRICGDSPLLDWRLVDEAIGMSEKLAIPAVVTNVFDPDMPAGQHVEAISSNAFKAGGRRVLTAEEREHVMTIFYRPDTAFDVFDLAGRKIDLTTARRPAYPLPSLALDTEEDLIRIRSVIARMIWPHWEYTWEETWDIAKSLA